MKRFLEMIEFVRSTGRVLSGDDLATPEGVRRAKGETLAREFFSLVEQAECLVFHPKNKNPISIIEKYGDDLDVNYDAPFRIFAYEVLGANITEPAGMRAHQEAMKDVLASPDPLAALTQKTMTGEVMTDEPVWIHCVLVHEEAPGQFNYFVYATIRSTQVVMQTTTLDRLTKEFVERVNREEVGSENARQRVRLGTSADKRQHTLRRIVHIRPKRQQPGIVANSSGRVIDWTHRFARRGFWRSQPGKLGKDREGIYRVHDWTWVVETIVGPEDKPLIKKARVVDDSTDTKPRGPVGA